MSHVDDGVGLYVVHVRVSDAQLLAVPLGRAHYPRGNGVLGSKPEAFSWESNTLTLYVSQGIQKRNKSMVTVVPLGLLVYWLVIQYTVMI